MSVLHRKSMLSIATSFMAVSLFFGGCDSKESTPAPEAKPAAAEKKVEPAKPIIPVAQMADWCPEHGVPESICVKCNETLAAGFKEKGDWCEEHKVPKSQDFVHNPELKEKFAAAYKEKYGKDAPALKEGAAH